MINSPEKIFSQYQTAAAFKETLGKHGLSEQNRINERFYVGDQWHGAACGSDRPLVRHNVIRRIGDFKIAELSSAPVDVRFFAEGFAQNSAVSELILSERKALSKEGKTIFAPLKSENEIALMVSALNSYRKTTEKRIGLARIIDLALRDAYITGTGAVYTYYDPDIETGLFADRIGSTQILGDIVCERIRVENIYFGDPAVTELQKQPFIILTEQKSGFDLSFEAKRFGAPEPHIDRLASKGEEKLTVFTKLYKVKKGNKTEVFAVKTTKDSIVRPDFSMGIEVYPLSIFCFEKREGCIYGQSEISYIIPNQIAINRMLTAGVWSAMSAGMPLMVVNGDLVGGEITNEPGQVIKVFGTPEETRSAINYINPPDHSEGYNQAVDSLIYNTLTQCGANEAALGDMEATNTSAIIELREASAKYLVPLKNRYYRFLEDIALVWKNFFFAMYGKRCLKISDENGIWYFPFDAAKYSSLVLSVNAVATEGMTRSKQYTLNTLGTLLEKGAITPLQYLKRIPEGIIPDLKNLIGEMEKEAENERI
ncbi:MAG: hypothetical protein E7540_03315 [Ruminococcaceae bacterium]|nr:hypothetical protein [Oscillospiraceae bacterium]